MILGEYYILEILQVDHYILYVFIGGILYVVVFGFFGLIFLGTYSP